MTKITETFMKEISYISSQLFRNDEYLTEKPLSLLLAQRSWFKQAVCPTRELAFFQLEEKIFWQAKTAYIEMCSACTQAASVWWDFIHSISMKLLKLHSIQIYKMREIRV